MERKPIFHIIIASGFGSGFCPVAPGTAGAVLAVVMWLALSFFLPSYLVLLITLALILIFTVLGIWSANVLAPSWGKDPSRVVVDEMVGVWIPLLAVGHAEYWYVLLSFILFRFFDILKPLGIKRMEKLEGGIGVMMDDVLAGVYSLLIILILKWVIG